MCPQIKTLFENLRIFGATRLHQYLLPEICPFSLETPLKRNRPLENAKFRTGQIWTLLKKINSKIDLVISCINWCIFEIPRVFQNFGEKWFSKFIVFSVFKLASTRWDKMISSHKQMFCQNRLRRLISEPLKPIKSINKRDKSLTVEQNEHCFKTFGFGDSVIPSARLTGWANTRIHATCWTASCWTSPFFYFFYFQGFWSFFF